MREIVNGVLMVRRSSRELVFGTSSSGLKLSTRHPGTKYHVYGELVRTATSRRESQANERLLYRLYGPNHDAARLLRFSRYARNI